MEKPTEYRISTITATGSVNTKIDLDVFFDHLTVIDADACTSSGVLYAEFSKEEGAPMTKGISKKSARKQAAASESKSKRFDNQVTVVYRMMETDIEVAKKNLNIKVFNNGNIQITGIKYIAQGRQMIDIIIDILRTLHSQGHATIVEDVSKLQNVDYSIRLINSDFKIGFPVKRELLYKVFTSKYENYCSFEPCIYPGVKIRYYYNEQNHRKDGLCYCHDTCEVGKGSGKGNKQCKKITVAVFQSGCVIITGAQSHDQIQDAYDFVIKVLLECRDDIEKKNVLPTTEETTEKKKYLINKKNIVYPENWNAKS